MSNRLILRELREAGLIGVPVFITLLGFYYYGMRIDNAIRVLLEAFGLGPGPFRSVPLLDPSAYLPLITLGCTFAFAAVVRQVVMDSMQQTFHSLLTLPVSLREVFLTKILVGVSVLLATLMVPLWIYALWADSEGSHPSPFEWSMLNSHVQIIFCVLPVYMGLFLLALWPWHRWLAGVFIFVTTVMAAIAMASFPWFLPWGVLLNLVICCAYASVILWVAEHRDY